MSIVVVYHQECKASLNFLNTLNDLPNYNIEYIDIYNDKIEADINIDVVPMLIINNKEIYKGKEAFDKIQELKTVKDTNSKIGKKMYREISIAPEDSSNKKNPVKFS